MVRGLYNLRCLNYFSKQIPRKIHFIRYREKHLLNNFSLTVKPLDKMEMNFKYPVVHRDDTKYTLHGVEILDPYQWLEDPDSEDTKKFVESQNNITMPYLQSCPERDIIKKDLTEVWDYPKYSCISKIANRYIFSKNTGLQNHGVYYHQLNLNDEPQVLIDPNTLSEDGTIAVTDIAISKDATLLAYAVSSSGSDWKKIHFRRIEDNYDFPEVLDHYKFSHITWTHDNQGIFYGRYHPERKADGTETDSATNQKLYYHRLGDDPSKDTLVLDFPDHPSWRMTPEISFCGKYLFVQVVEGCKDSLLYYCDISSHYKGIYEKKLDLIPIVSEFKHDQEYVINVGSKCIFVTNRDAPRSKVVKVDLNNPTPDKWEDLVPEHETRVLVEAVCVNENLLVLHYKQDVKSILQIHSLETGDYIRSIPIDVGTISSLRGDMDQTEMFYGFTSFLDPNTVYRYDFTQAKPTPQVIRKTEIKGIDTSNFVTHQVFYPSKDGKKIPMFIVHRKDLKLDSSAPCILYGYGGFNIPLYPSFSTVALFFIHHFNGIFVEANLRGGGEYGDDWHDAGRLFNKQNVFNDFQAAAEYLIKNNYTRRDKLTIRGGSNGGLLVGACMNQRPDLFGAAIADVGVMDMLKFHKFTIGKAWCSDYGNPDEKEHFQNLIKFSPLHNVKVPKDGVQYPATLLFTADHDDRVVPLHSLKFIAELQHTLGHLQQQRNPLLIRIETKAGHGSGKPTSKIIEENVDKMCFMIQALGYKYA